MRNWLLLPFLVVFLIPGSGIAQTIMEDVVFLNNGSIYRGKIIDSTQVTTLKIECYDRNIYVINRVDIRECTKNKVDFEDRELTLLSTTRRDTVLHQYLKKQIKFNIGFAYGLNVKGDNFELNTKRLSFSVLYNINKRNAIGLQTGVIIIQNSQYSSLLTEDVKNQINAYFFEIEEEAQSANNIVGRLSLPVSVCYENVFHFNRLSTIFHIGVGYDFNLSKPISIEKENFISYYENSKTNVRFEWRNGLIINPEFGLAIRMNSKMLLMPSLGYMWNKFSYVYTRNVFLGSNITVIEKNNVSSNFCYLKLALGF